MPKIQMLIEYEPESAGVTLKGPLQNRILCYGMLEMAREMVAAAGQKSDGGDGGGPRILVPRLVPPDNPFRG